MKPALIIGSTCADVIIRVDHLPKSQEDLHIVSQTMSPGGCAYNVSNMLRLLNVPHTFITPVGGGLYGDFVARELTRARIPIHISLPEQENGCCYCLVEANGERTFLSFHGAEYTFRKSWMSPFPAAAYDLAYVCGMEIEEPTGEELIEYLEENPSLRVFYAPGPRVAGIGREKNDRLLALRPILHLNEAEALAWTGENSREKAAARLHAATGNAVILTLGGDGAYCVEADGYAWLVPPAPAPRITDTIGAGDAHAGTVLSCLTMDMPLYEAVVCANRAAAAVLGVSGACLPPENLPDMPELAAYRRRVSE